MHIQDQIVELGKRRTELRAELREISHQLAELVRVAYTERIITSKADLGRITGVARATIDTWIGDADGPGGE